MATAPDEVSGLAEFSTIPEDPAYPKETWGTRVVALAAVYDGPAETGEAVTRPLRELGHAAARFQRTHALHDHPDAL